MQLLTWGTILGAVGSAAWLAAFDTPDDVNARALSDAVDLIREAPQAGPAAPVRAEPQGAMPAQPRPSSGSAASAR